MLRSLAAFDMYLSPSRRDNLPHFSPYRLFWERPPFQHLDGGSDVVVTVGDGNSLPPREPLPVVPVVLPTPAPPVGDRADGALSRMLIGC